MSDNKSQKGQGWNSDKEENLYSNEWKGNEPSSSPSSGKKEQSSRETRNSERRSFGPR